MEKRKTKREALGEIETERPGFLGSQDAYCVGNFKGIGKVCQQTFIDTYAKAADAKLYAEKTAITAADMPNDRVVPFFDGQGIPLLRILADRGTERCGNLENRAYELFLSIEGIDCRKTKAYTPQTNGICERFNKTTKNEFYDSALRKKICASLKEPQTDADAWLRYYNREPPHAGKYYCGKTPTRTFNEGKRIAIDKSNRLAYQRFRQSSLIRHFGRLKIAQRQIKSCLAQF